MLPEIDGLTWSRPCAVRENLTTGLLFLLRWQRDDRISGLELLEGRLSGQALLLFGELSARVTALPAPQQWSRNPAACRRPDSI